GHGLDDRVAQREVEQLGIVFEILRPLVEREGVLLATLRTVVAALLDQLAADGDDAFNARHGALVEDGVALFARHEAPPLRIAAHPPRDLAAPPHVERLPRQIAGLGDALEERIWQLCLDAVIVERVFEFHIRHPPCRRNCSIRCSSQSARAAARVGRPAPRSNHDKAFPACASIPRRSGLRPCRLPAGTASTMPSRRRAAWPRNEPAAGCASEWRHTRAGANCGGRSRACLAAARRPPPRRRRRSGTAAAQKPPDRPAVPRTGTRRRCRLRTPNRRSAPAHRSAASAATRRNSPPATGPAAGRPKSCTCADNRTPEAASGPAP